MWEVALKGWTFNKLQLEENQNDSFPVLTIILIYGGTYEDQDIWSIKKPGQGGWLIILCT